eukprot:scaffold262404_cov35-Tisochrysis_lutea.AAC.3
MRHSSRRAPVGGTAGVSHQRLNTRRRSPPQTCDSRGRKMRGYAYTSERAARLHQTTSGPWRGFALPATRRPQSWGWQGWARRWKVAARKDSIGPKGARDGRLGAPPEEFKKCGYVVRRIGVAGCAPLGHEGHLHWRALHTSGGLEESSYGWRPLAEHHVIKQLVSRPRVCWFAKAPRSSVECGGEPDLAVGGGTLEVVRAVLFTAPRKVAVVRRTRVGVAHVALRPAPERIKRALIAALRRDHHAVRHALGAHVVAFAALTTADKSAAVPHFEEDSLVRLVTEEELTEDGIDSCTHSCWFSQASLNEYVAIASRVSGAAASLTGRRW